MDNNTTNTQTNLKENTDVIDGGKNTGSGEGFAKRLKGWAMETPGEFVHDLTESAFGDYKKEMMAGIITTLVMTFLCYFYEMIYGLGCPDLLCEGLRYYRNADYATSQARWMIRFINTITTKNVIIPSVTVLLYCAMIGISALIICRMLKINNALYVSLLSAIMISFPVISHQFAYLYMALAYSFAFLAAVVGVMLVRKRKVLPFVLAVLCFLMMMGSYQSYICAVSALGLVMLLFDAANDESLGRCFSNLGLTALAGVLAALADLPFSKLMMAVFKTGTESRVSGFSLKSIVENTGFSFKACYIYFFSYFKKDTLSREKVYAVVFAVILILSIYVIIGKFKNKKIGQAVTILVSVLILPIGMNFIALLIPTEGVRDLMRYQYVLVFAILLFFHSYIGKKIFNNMLAYLSIAAIALFLLGNVISANCTTFMYKYSYDYAEKQALLMLEEIYEIDGYVPDKTPIVMGGAFSYTPVKDRYPMIFRYAEQEGGPVFWGNIYGMISCRYHFFMDYFGVNAEYFTNEEYLNAVQSEEYAEMPVWPEKGSVRMIGDKVVVKIYETAPDQ